MISRYLSFSSPEPTIFLACASRSLPQARKIVGSGDENGYLFTRQGACVTDVTLSYKAANFIVNEILRVDVVRPKHETKVDFSHFENDLCFLDIDRCAELSQPSCRILRPTTLRYVALKCCDRLAEALKTINPGGTPIYGLYRYVPRDRVWF